jgi:glycogen operon protein
MWLNGEGLPETDIRGRALHDDSFLVLFNAHHDVIEFKLPDLGGGSWHGEIDTATETGDVPAGHATPQGTYPLQGRSLAVLRQAGPGSA